MWLAYHILWHIAMFWPKAVAIVILFYYKLSRSLSSSCSSSSGTRLPSIGFAACIWCYIRRTHWPAIRNWRFYQAVLLWARLIAPTIFRHDSFNDLPPLTCVCMCAVNAGGCVIDLLSRAGFSPALYCAWSQETIQTQIICMSPPVPFVYPRIWHVWWDTGDKNYLRHSHAFFRRPAPTGNRTRVVSVIGQSVSTRPLRLLFKQAYLTIPFPRGIHEHSAWYELAKTRVLSDMR